MIKIYHQKWREIHVKALSVHTRKEFTEYCRWIRNLANNFPCKKCGYHLLKYIKDNPPEKSNHPFNWSWKLHNNVNHRLGKEIMSYNEASNFWSQYL